ncbi:major allergen Pru ar 1-like [Tasmannia lanceolata]|uniref:major allergen Pru ar 1-like n=1 Tax=Tasmannia lanceolata TaxID=3420 RepID=UPI004063EDDB
MGIFGFSFELKSPVAASKMFKASVLETHILLPKVMSQIVSSGEIIEGDGGVGSVKYFKYTEVVPYNYVKERVDILDKENFEYKYTVIEGEDVGTKLISIVYHIKFEAAEDGGCIIKTSGEYNTMEGVEYSEEEIDFGRNGLMGMYKIVEAYVLANPDAYA